MRDSGSEFQSLIASGYIGQIPLASFGMITTDSGSIASYVADIQVFEFVRFNGLPD